jgi:hypothetical protein
MTSVVLAVLLVCGGASMCDSVLAADLEKDVNYQVKSSLANRILKEQIT